MDALGGFLTRAKHALALVMLALLLVPSVAQTPPEWWRDTTWYLLFVRSFYDSDGDGIGDLRGVIEKLNYLNDGDPTTSDDLGITGIWLMPITKAHSYHGYDTLDYYDVDPDYGTLDDFRELIAEAEKRGIRIVMDLVVNHTSSKHEWFVRSAQGDPQYADWYVWADENPNYAGPWGAPAWYRRGDRFYYAPFWSEMPDLNYDNPAVTAEMYNVARFWLEETGVHGFRLDAIKYVVEQELNNVRLLQNAPANREWLRAFNAYVKSINPDALTIGEVWDSTISVVRYVNNNAVDIAFEFELAQDIIGTAQTGNAKRAMDKMAQLLKEYDTARYAPFTTNHDMGRLLTLLGDNVDANKVAAGILLTAAGSPFVYYGEELGMVGGKPDENIRRPMQWDGTPNKGGFTTGRAWQPLGLFYQQRNVAAQTTDPNSLLSHYRALIHLRNASHALRRGEVVVPRVAGSSAVYSLLRLSDEETVLVVINTSGREVTDYRISVRGVALTAAHTPQVLFGAGEPLPLTLNDKGELTDYAPKLTLAPYEMLILRLGD